MLYLGSNVLFLLKKKSSLNVEGLFQEIKKTNDINIDQYYNILTFLWTADLIDVEDHYISKNYVSK